MYDEFGNLKKKFRAKMQQTEAGQKVPGVGRAGWDVDELGIVILLVDFSRFFLKQILSFD